MDDRELAMTFHARTSDFQDVAVQATVTYRVSDPAIAAARLDFSIDPDTGVWRGAPLEQLSTLLTETAQQHALDVLARTTLASALVDGVAAVRERVASGLAAEPRLPATGIEIVAVRVVALRPERLRTDYAHYLVYPQRSADHSGLLAFRDWVHAQARDYVARMEPLPDDGGGPRKVRKHSQT